MRKKVFLVTGANKGIGKEIARQLLKKGHVVYLGVRNKGRGDQAIGELKFLGDVRLLIVDVTDSDSHVRAAEQIKTEVGYLDGLINNAGISLEYLPPSQATLTALRNTFETNYFGVVNLTQTMLSLLRSGESKVIVNVSSELGSTTLHGVPEWKYHAVTPLAYNSSKAALNSFTVLLAKELSAEGFRVNAVNPGYVATDLNAFSGPGTVSDGAAISVKCALLGPDGPTGQFLTDNGSLPW